MSINAFSERKCYDKKYSTVFGIDSEFVAHCVSCSNRWAIEIVIKVLSKKSIKLRKQ